MRFADRRVGGATASMLVDHRSANVAGERLHIAEAYGISTVAPSVSPDSMASCALTASFSAYS